MTVRPILDEARELCLEFLWRMVDAARAAIDDRALIDRRRREHDRAVARALDELQIALRSVELRIMKRQKRDVRRMQHVFINRKRHELPIILLRIANILLVLRLECLIKQLVSEHAEINLARVRFRCAVDRRQDVLPVPLTVQRAKENRHTPLSRALLCDIVTRCRKLLQVVFHHEDVRIVLPHDLGERRC